MSKIKAQPEINDQQQIDYQDDILKVKKIWKDLKNVHSPTNKQHKNKLIQTKSTSNKQTKTNNKKQTVYSKKNNKQQSSEEKNYNEFKQTCRVVGKNNNNIQKNSNQKNNNKSIDKTADVIEFSTNNNNNFKQQQQQQLNRDNNNNIKNAYSNLIYSNNPTNPNFSSNKIHQKSTKQLYHLQQYTTNLNIQNHSLQTQLQTQSSQLSLLRITNQRHLDRISFLQSIIQQKDKQINQLKHQQNLLMNQKCKLISGQGLLEYGKVEYQNYKNDSRRLLKMLQSTEEYKMFAELAMEDNGVRFLHHVNKQKKGKIDLVMNSNKQTSPTRLHFCTCNKQFLPEANFWLPSQIYTHSKTFLQQKSNQLTQAQLQLLLYQINKFYRERQRKIINYVNSMKGIEIGKYKRKIEEGKLEKQTKNDGKKWE